MNHLNFLLKFCLHASDFGTFGNSSLDNFNMQRLGCASCMMRVLLKLSLKLESFT